jgi:hypothetical protein
LPVSNEVFWIVFVYTHSDSLFDILLGDTIEMNILSRVKGLVVSDSAKPRSIKAGAFRGITMELNLKMDTQFYLGLYERELYKDLDLYSRDAKTGIDIGARAGEYSIYFLKQKSMEKVMVFELLEENCFRIKHNAALSGFKNDPRFDIRNNFVSNRVDGICVPLDSALPDIIFPCVIKLDVDGEEVNVLNGAKQLLQQSGVRWIIEAHSAQLEKDCLHILQTAGYKTRVIKDAWWRVIVPEVGRGYCDWIVADKA